MQNRLHRTGCLLAAILLLWTAGCRTPEAPKGKTMSIQNLLDDPAVQHILFHPRRTGRTSLPSHARDIDVEVEPGITIGCRLFTAGKDSATILFFHGNGEVVPDYDAIGPEYVAQNINFLVTDYRGYGWSTGSPAASHLLADAHVLYDHLVGWLQEQGYSEQIFLMGRSLGSACAIELAAARNEEIKGLIIESGFALTLPLAKTLGLDLEAMGIREEQTFNNSAKIRKVTKPTLLLHGQQDTLIPLYQAEKLHAECGARSKELQVVPGADHNTLIAVGGVYYFQAIRKFVDRVTGASDWRRRRRAFKERQSDRQR